MEPTLRWIDDKFGKKPAIAEANTRALKAGYNYGETTELFHAHVPRRARPSSRRARTARSPATRRPRSASSPRRKLAKRQLVYGSYPITPASDILHELATLQELRRQDVPGRGRDRRDRLGDRRRLRRRAGRDRHQRPGHRLKTEAIGLAVMTELPLVIIDVQRGGPRTGLPTKTEQADLLQAMFGRNGESPGADRRAGHAGRLLRLRHRGVRASRSST